MANDNNNPNINWSGKVDHPWAGVKNHTVPAVENIGLWADNPYTWGDVSLILEIIDGIGTINRRARLDQYLDKYPQQKKRLIHLICRVKGEKVYDETKEVGDIEIKLEDVNMVIDKVVKLNVSGMKDWEEVPWDYKYDK
jgi:hypothetical protein